MRRRRGQLDSEESQRGTKKRRRLIRKAEGGRGYKGEGIGIKKKLIYGGERRRRS